MMTIDAIIRTIQLMLAPVVMVTACTSYINTLSFDYQFIVSNIRSMSREHLDLLQAASSSETGVSVSTLDAVSKERLHEIENELPSLLQRHGFIGSASFRGKQSKNWSGGREQKDCPSLDLIRKPIKSRRTTLAKPAYHRRDCQQRSNSGAIRPG